MEMMTSWHQPGQQKAHQAGLQAGRQEHKEDLVIRQIRRRFGDVSKSLIEQIDHLTVEQLNELGEALFDFNNLQ